MTIGIGLHICMSRGAAKTSGRTVGFLQGLGVLGSTLEMPNYRRSAVKSLLQILLQTPFRSPPPEGRFFARRYIQTADTKNPPVDCDAAGLFVPVSA